VRYGVKKYSIADVYIDSMVYDCMDDQLLSGILVGMLALHRMQIVEAIYHANTHGSMLLQHYTDMTVVP
jgi:hypothetical protein